MFDQQLRASMFEVYVFNLRLSLLHALHGLSPARCFEYPLAARSLGLAPGQRLLDIGSGKSCFPLFMALRRRVRVTLLDPGPGVMVQKQYARRLGLIREPISERFDLLDNPRGALPATRYATPDGRLSIEVGDATAMPFAEREFDAVSCISTIEHIPGEGDARAAREIARVLRPGGLAFLSVPYGQRHAEGRTHGGNFERTYDLEALHERLVAPAGLRLAQAGFLVDERGRRVTDATYYHLPGRWRYVLGWSSIFFAAWLARRDAADERDARFAFLLLQKT